MDLPTVIAAVSGAIVAVGGMVGAGITTYLTMKHKMKMEADKQRVEIEDTVTTHYSKFVDGLSRELELHRANSTSTLNLLRVIEEDHTQCRVALATMYRYLCEQYAHSARMCAQLRKLLPGEHVEEGPNLPPDPMSNYKDRTNFIARTVAQTASNLEKIKTESSTLLPPLPPRKVGSDPNRNSHPTTEQPQN